MFNLDPNMRCFLCNIHGEDHNHLFFQCELSTLLWTMVQVKCIIQIPVLNWKNLINWLSNEWRLKNLKTLSWKLSLASTVYHIWMECNYRLHNRSSNSVTHIRDKIFDMARMKMASLKGVQDTTENRETAMVWNLPISIFI